MRGFGEHQSTVSNADTNPVPDFSSPMTDDGTLNFFADTKSKDTAVPVNAKIYVGDYEARVDADRRHQSGDSRHRHRRDRQPRQHGTVAPTAPGPDSLLPKGKSGSVGDVQLRRSRTRLRVRPLQREGHQARQVNRHHDPLREELASSTQGATIVGDALGTNTNLGEPHRRHRVDQRRPDRRAGSGPLGRRRARDRRSRCPSKASACRRCSCRANDRFTALRSFNAYACKAGNPDNPTCDGSVDAGWKQIVESPDNAFPSVNPRPVTPDMTLRYFKARTPATHVKFVVVANQCTGQPSYPGDQDLDPANNADCQPPPFVRTRCTRPSCRSSARRSPTSTARALKTSN